MTYLCQKCLLLTVVTTSVFLPVATTLANETTIRRSADFADTNNRNSGDLAGLENRDDFEWSWSLYGDPTYIDDESNETIYLGTPDNTTILQETNQYQSGDGQRVRVLFPLTD